MSINPLLANRLPYASASAVKQDDPTAFVVKNEERSSWKKPVYYTALAVAGIGSAFFIYNSGILFGHFLGGIFSSLSPPPSPQPSPTPSSPPTPQPSPPSPQPSPTPTPTQEDKWQDLIQTVRQAAQDPQKSETEKAEMMEIANLIEEWLPLYVAFGNLDRIDRNRKDCPDLQTVSPVPFQMCDKVIYDDGKYKTLHCFPINSYITTLLKEDCPKYSLFPAGANETSCDF